MGGTELHRVGERTVTQYEGNILKLGLSNGEIVLALKQGDKFFELERIHRGLFIEGHEIIQAYVSSWPLPECLLKRNESGDVCKSSYRIAEKVLVENACTYMQDPADIKLGEHPYYLILTTM